MIQHSIQAREKRNIQIGILPPFPKSSLILVLKMRCKVSFWDHFNPWTFRYKHWNTWLLKHFENLNSQLCFGENCLCFEKRLTAWGHFWCDHWMGQLWKNRGSTFPKNPSNISISMVKHSLLFLTWQGCYDFCVWLSVYWWVENVDLYKE